MNILVSSPSKLFVAIPLICIGLYMGTKVGSRIEINVTIHTAEGGLYTNNKLRGDSSSPPDPAPSSLQQQQKGGAIDHTTTLDEISTHISSEIVNYNYNNIDDTIPSCARDVFVTLHKELGGNDEHSCRGMLIRDDIILTTSECSVNKFTFDFITPQQDAMVLQAYPYTELNSKMGDDSRLGFLKADAPVHYYFLDQPVHRARMFLSLLSTDDINNEVVAISCDDDMKPIARNFPGKANEMMIPLYDLNGLVPDDVLWEHIDIHSAPTLEFNSQRWWSKAISLEDEEGVIRKWMEPYRGPKGSISIPAAHDGWRGRAAAFCEVIDPRGHRRGECFSHYYDLWRKEKPFSGAHFFDWLDFGAGKSILDDNNVKIANKDPTAFETWSHDSDRCVKSNFNEKTVQYFDDKQRTFHEVYIAPSEDGTKLIWRYKGNNELVPPSSMDDPHLYMWDMDKKFYIVDSRWNKKKYNAVKHTGLIEGKPALAAGKAYFEENGEVWGINFSSGHYRPEIEAIALMYQDFKDQNYNLTALHWVGRMEWTEHDCDKAKWEEFDIPGFNAASLEESCREVTNSPTWILKEDV